jgi:hypothetical protein
MIKIIILVLGIAGGFGGGIYWAHHNPEAAAKISAEEEKRFLEAQLAISEKIQSRLDKLDAPKSTKGAPGAGFLAGNPSAAQADVQELKSDAQKQKQELRQRLDQLK